MVRGRASTRPRKLPSQDRSKETVEVILGATALVLKREGYPDRLFSFVNRLKGEAEEIGIELTAL